VAEYVLQISGQKAEPARAARGDALFHDGAKGNCFDCHGADGTGSDPIGSTNLTQKRLYLYGSDRASILQSINEGRRGSCRRLIASLSSRRLRPFRSTSCLAPENETRVSLESNESNLARTCRVFVVPGLHHDGCRDD
jgi:cbb3-type cytochrome c oxidase subunit III